MTLVSRKSTGVAEYDDVAYDDAFVDLVRLPHSTRRRTRGVDRRDSRRVALARRRPRAAARAGARRSGPRTGSLARRPRRRELAVAHVARRVSARSACPPRPSTAIRGPAAAGPCKRSRRAASALFFQANTAAAGRRRRARAHRADVTRRRRRPPSRATYGRRAPRDADDRARGTAFNNGTRAPSARRAPAHRRPARGLRRRVGAARRRPRRVLHGQSDARTRRRRAVHDKNAGSSACTIRYRLHISSPWPTLQPGGLFDSEVSNEHVAKLSPGRIVTRVSSRSKSCGSCGSRPISRVGGLAFAVAFAVASVSEARKPAPRSCARGIPRVRGVGVDAKRERP